MPRSVTRGIGILLALAALVLGGAAAAWATPAGPARATETTPGTDDAGSSGDLLIKARVRTEASGGTPAKDVTGVTVTVTQGSTAIGTAVTDATGTAEIPVPEIGDYTVELDLEALPADVAKLIPRLNPIQTTVNAGSPRTVAFRLGTSSQEAADRSRRDDVSGSRALQLAAQGLRFGLIIALASIGLSLIFGTTGLTNFAHSELITLGALVAYFFNVAIGMPLIVAAAITLIICGVFGWLNDKLLWEQLRRRGTGLIAMMIVSIGLSILLRYLFLYFFGGSTRSYADYATQSGLDLGPITLRPIDLFSMALATVMLVAVGLALQRTRLGKATRAVSDNPALAAASGIDVDRVIQTVWVAGAVLAALAGILLGMAQGINYQMGFQVLLLVFAAVTLGGLGTAFGALVGSLVVGLFIELSTLFVPTELKNIGALAVLILILLVRPQGILGRRERIG